MSYPSRGARYGVIGVYDKTNVDHLCTMVHHAKEATRGPFKFEN